MQVRKRNVMRIFFKAVLDKKPASPEFNSLKDIDGNIIKHEEVNQEEPEDPNQTVHFKVDSNEEVEDEPESPANIHLNQKPRKSILKKSLSSKSFGGDKHVEIDLTNFKFDLLSLGTRGNRYPKRSNCWTSWRLN